MADQRPLWFDRLAGVLRHFTADDTLATPGNVKARQIVIDPQGDLAAGIVGQSAGTVTYLIDGSNISTVVGAFKAPSGATGTTFEFDSGDYTTFDRTNNKYRWVIGNTVVAEIDANGLVGVRRQLTADRTYYVATTGNDANDGSSGSPFLTIQKAVDVAATLDFGVYNVTIQLAAGTYAENVLLKTIVGSGMLYIKGPTSGGNADVRTIAAQDVVGRWQVESLYMTTTSGGTPTWRLRASGGGATLFFNSIRFGTATASHFEAGNNGVCALVSTSGSYEIYGSAARHAYAAEGGQVRARNCSVGLANSPVFTQGLVFCIIQGRALFDGWSVLAGSIGSGSKKYAIESNSVLYAPGTTLPGSVSGTTATGGQVV